MNGLNYIFDIYHKIPAALLLQTVIYSVNSFKVKLALDFEINIHRKLLEGEESRLSMVSVNTVLS